MAKNTLFMMISFDLGYFSINYGLHQARISFHMHVFKQDLDHDSTGEFIV